MTEIANGGPGAAPDYLAARTSPRERRMRSVLAVAIVGLLGGGLYGIVGHASATGGSTPSSAVRALLTAAENEDPLGVLAAVAPAERDVFRDPITDIANELKRLDVLSGDLDLNHVTGLDVTFADVKLDEKSLRDDLAMVTFTGGTGQIGFDPSKLPVGGVVRKQVGDEPPKADPGKPEPLAQDDPPRIATIKVGDRWYVSLAYTLAEAYRDSTGAGGTAPVSGGGVVAKGAATPEKAVEEFVRGAAALDVRRLVELSPPDSYAALHEYAPLFLADAESGISSAKVKGAGAEITKLTASADRSGDRARVAIQTLGVSIRTGEGGNNITIDFDGKCVTVGGFEGFSDDGSTAPKKVCEGDEQASAYGLGKLGFRISTVERDGEWYVDLTRTMLDSMVEALKALDKADIEKAFGGDMGPFGLVPFASPFLFGQMFGAGVETRTMAAVCAKGTVDSDGSQTSYSGDCESIEYEPKAVPSEDPSGPPPENRDWSPPPETQPAPSGSAGQ